MSAPIPAPVSRSVTLATGMAVTIDEYGVDKEGTGVLVLHGGAGPRTMAGFSAALSEHAYVVTPTHPGFDGTPRPPRFDTIGDLAEAYLDLLDELALKDVMVVGNSIGGWIAAEMALRDSHRRLAALVLLNAVGVRGQGEDRVRDIRGVAPAEVSKLSFANAAFRPDFSTFSDAQRAGMAANQNVLASYVGDDFSFDPKLRRRLHRIDLPVLVAWGEQDGIAPLGYGRAYADAFPDGHFVPVPGAGHFPHIEQLGATLGAIGEFVDTVVKPA